MGLLLGPSPSWLCYLLGLSFLVQETVGWGASPGPRQAGLGVQVGHQPARQEGLLVWGWRSWRWLDSWRHDCLDQPHVGTSIYRVVQDSSFPFPTQARCWCLAQCPRASV